jgi:A/G-specific adenine glycosylase
VREQHNGVLPEDYEKLYDLPGIGAYTAAAVSSIAFNAPHAAVDGNVKRVLSRIFDLATASSAQLQTAADRLLDPARPGDFNQAMMELGATVCTPRNPHCAQCPVSSACAAYRNGTVHIRPAPKKKAPLPEETVNTLVACNRGEVLIVQRPSTGLLAGLWEFPEIDDPGNHTYAGQLTHTFTHKRITYRVFTTHKRVRVRVRERPSWVPTAKLKDLALPTAQRNVWKLALPSFGS